MNKFTYFLLLIFSFILPIIKHIIKTIKFTNTIDEPIGNLSIIHDVIMPILKDNTLIRQAKINTYLNDLNICLEDRVGKIINAVIRRAPITFIPITIVKDISIDKTTLMIFVCIPLDLENVSSNVIENILGYNNMYVVITINATITLNTTSVKLTPNKEPYK